MTDKTWKFSAVIDPDGDLSLEWYSSKSDVVTVCFSKGKRPTVSWSALIDSVSHHGCVVSGSLHIERD